MELKTVKCQSCGAIIDLEQVKSYYIMEKKYVELEEKLNLAIKQIDILNTKLSKKTKESIEDEL